MQAFLAANPHLDKAPDAEVLSWICQNRSIVTTTSRSRELVRSKVDGVHAAGGKVFVALGKSVSISPPLVTVDRSTRTLSHG